MSGEADVAIIGGGITGITSAYLLAKEGKRVTLFEKEKVGEGMTAYTTGFLTCIIDVDPSRLIKLLGIEKARLIIASHKEAMDDVEKIIKTEKIECDFARCANYIYANTPKEEKNLLKMSEALNLFGVPAKYKKDATLKFANAGYIEIPNQAKFNAMKYVAALAERAKKHGAEIVEDSEVKNLESIKAKNILVATYAPFNNPPPLAHTSTMYRSYVLEFRVPKKSLVEGIYQDALEPYHYFRIDKEGEYDRLLLGGADDLEVSSADPEINFEEMRTYARKLLVNQTYEEVQHWSGRILNSLDGLAYIGAEKGSKVFYATTFSGNGMTYSYIASKLFLDHILAQQNPYAELYALDREISWWASLFK